MVALSNNAYVWNQTACNITYTVGNVGIGTSSPVFKLDVSGNIRSIGDIMLVSSNRLNIYNSNSSLQVRSGLTCNLEFNSDTPGNIVACNGGGNLGVGVAIPSYKLDISGNARVTHASTQAFVIRQSNTTNQNMPAEIFFDRTPLSSTQMASMGIDGTGRNFFISVNAVDRVNIDTSGRVGIATTTPGYTLEINGALYASGDITALSDRRYKTNISPIIGGLDKVLALTGYTYNRKHVCVKDQEDPNKAHIGLIAQEVECILPEVVTYDRVNDKYGVNYGSMVAVLVEAIKDMRHEYTCKIDALEFRIKELEEVVEALKYTV